MELYTSLTQLKMALNGGQLPPMTPIPVEAHSIIDPAFTPGLGALEEDMEGGLRCPVRGCGKWHHKLTEHINRSHADIGGAAAVKQLLSIPHTARLVSGNLRARQSAHAHRLLAAGTLRPVVRKRLTPSFRKKRAVAISKARKTVGARNLSDRCVAQLTHKLMDVKNTLGRSPSREDARAILGPAIVRAIEDTFGTWNAAKAHCGMAVHMPGWDHRRYRLETVLDMFSAWHEAHGDLPNEREARASDRTPMLPSSSAVLRVMGVSEWDAAMLRIASALNVYGGRYGLPVRDETAA